MYYFSANAFIMRWMSNSLVVTPFLKLIRKPVLMLINHHVFPVLLLVQSGKRKSSVSLWLYPFFALDICYLLSCALLTNIYKIQPLFIRDKSQSLQLLWSHFLFPAFCSGRFLRAVSVSIDLVGFICPIQTKWSSQGTLPSVFLLVMHDYTRG